MDTALIFSSLDKSFLSKTVKIFSKSGLCWITFLPHVVPSILAISFFPAFCQSSSWFLTIRRRLLTNLFGSDIVLNVSLSITKSGLKRFSTVYKSLLLFWSGVAVRNTTASALRQKSSTPRYIHVLELRILWASSTIKRSKCGIGSSSARPKFLFFFEDFDCVPRMESSLNKEYGITVLLCLSGHSPSRSVSCMHSASALPSNWVKFSSKRFISSCHFLSATRGRGHITRTEFREDLASISFRIKPASIVLPTPTSSATSIRGLSDLIIFRAGLNWYGTKSILAAFNEYKFPEPGLFIW